jgi:predicted transglutaminase-like cysteine proteinase
MLVGLLALAAMTATSPRITAIPPVDQAARNTFPNADPREVDQVAAVNRLVNGLISYEDDRTHYGQEEKWVAWPTDFKGDCEDYALSKLESLRVVGWDITSRTRIRTVRIKHGTEGHAVLEVRLSDGSVAVLDNNFAEPMRRRELERTWGYTFYNW